MSDEKPATPSRGPRRRRRRKAGGPEGAAAKATGATAAAAAPPAETPQPKRDRGQDRRPRKGDRDRNGGRRDGKRPEKAAPVIKSTEVTVDRGADYTITKRTEFDVNTHKPVAVRYKLTREGLPEPQVHSRLADAREAAKAPIELPPEPPPAEEEPPTTEPPASESEPA